MTLEQTEGLCALTDATIGAAMSLLVGGAPRSSYNWGLLHGGMRRYGSVLWGEDPPGRAVSGGVSVAGPDHHGPAIGYIGRTSTYIDRPDALMPLCFQAEDNWETFAIAHVGGVPNAVEWCREERLTWLSQCDSEVIGRSLARTCLHLYEAVGPQAVWTSRLQILRAKLTAPYALAVWTPGNVWLLRRGAPLYASRTRASSRPFRGGRLLDDERIVRLGSLDGR